MQDFVNGEAVPFPRSPKGRKTGRIAAGNFSNQLRGNHRRKAVVPPPSKLQKTATRRLISRIVLASVVNVSSRCMTDDSTTNNTRLLDRKFIPKTEQLDLQFFVQ